MATAMVDRLLLEVSGPGVRSSTVDPVKMLELGASFLALIQKMAKDDGRPMHLRGLSVEDKCVAIAIPLPPADVGYVREVSDVSGYYAVGEAEVPPGLRGCVGRLKTALRAFPADCTQKVIIGPWVRDISAPAIDAKQNSPYSIESMRVVVLKVGGKSPTLRLQSLFDESTFTIQVDRETAKLFAGHLYEYADLTLKTLRTLGGRIVNAKLAGDAIFVSKDDPTEAWRRWFQPHAEHWNGIADIEGELRNRDRS